VDVGVGSGVGVAVGATWVLPTCFVGGAANVATSVDVTCVVAVGSGVDVLVGVGVAAACLLHPTSKADVVPRTMTVSKSSVTESAPGRLCRTIVFGFRNPLSSYGNRGEDTVKPGICQK
jgi:hypothetical protein